MNIKNTFKQELNAFLSASLVITAMTFSAYSISASPDVTAPVMQSQPSYSTPKMASSKTQLISNRYLIKLNDPALSVQMIKQAKALAISGNTNAKTQSLRSSLSSSLAAKEIRQKLINTQQVFSRQLTNKISGAKVTHHYTTLVNAVEVVAGPDDIQKLRELPQVKAVYKVRQRYINLDSSHEVIKSNAAWQLLGGESQAGKGIKIAVVDTGIRNNNPMFSDGGFSAPDLSSNTYLNQNPDYCRSEQGDASFCNNKLIVARWENPAEYGMEVYENEYLSPLAFNGHGTHVAGIATGNKVAIEFEGVSTLISGVAPASYLMVYKAMFIGPDGSASGTDTMLLNALEHAVNDGADVINNSWGSGGGEDPSTSIFNEVFENAEALGVVMVNASGNSSENGRGQTINCPACIESGIGVANTTHGRFLGLRMDVAGVEYNIYPDKPIEQSLQMSLVSWNSYDPLGYEGCYKWDTPVFDNALVVIDYKPVCTFEEVADNVKSAGGAAVLIYQSGAYGMGTYEPFEPFPGGYSLPIFGVSRETGLELLNLAYTGKLTASIDKQPTRNIETQYVDKMHPFSSNGPNVDATYLKPDMSAPGTNILSAYSPEEFVSSPLPGFTAPSDGPFSGTDGPVFAMLTGTSMAAPHVAGAAALLKQAYPKWSPLQIKSALTSTSNPNVLLGEELASPFWQGAGRLDLEKAINTQLTFDKVSYSDPACILDCSFTNKMQNMTDTEKTWQATVVFDDGLTTGSLSATTFQLGAKGSTTDHADFTLTVDTSLSVPTKWTKWTSGKVILTDAEQHTQHLPIVVYANDASNTAVLNLVANSSGLGSNDELSYSAFFRNKNFTTAPEVSIQLPDNVSFVNGSEHISVNRGASTALNYDSNSHSLKWQGNLQLGSMQLQESNPWGSTTLASLGVEPIKCSGIDSNCASFNTLIDFDFYYSGNQFSQLTVSDNGFVVPGNVAIRDLAALFNQNLPQIGDLNNVIAPFWTEFYTEDYQTDDQNGSGTLRSGIREVNGSSYLIVEWNSLILPQVEGFEVESRSYTFQLIIEQGTDNIWFNYIDIPSMPENVTIGAENTWGDIGVSYFFDGEGQPLPTFISDNGYSLKLTTQLEGVAQLDFSVKLADEQRYARGDNFTVTEDEKIVLDVLENDTVATSVVISAELNAGPKYKAKRTQLFSVDSLEPSSLEIRQSPQHGSASILDGKVTYLSNSNYSGPDSFSYQVAATNSKNSQETFVELNVLNVNDAPVWVTESNNSPVDIKAGKVVKLSVQASDPDNDALTYHWTQTSGVIVDFSQTDNVIWFNAPLKDNKTIISFDVIASDGVLSTTTLNQKVMVKENKSGGSINVPILLILLIFRLLTLRCIYNKV